MERMRRWWGMPSRPRRPAVRRPLDEVTGLPRYSPADASLAAGATGSAMVIEVDSHLMVSQVEGFRAAEALLVEAAGRVAALVGALEGRVRRMSGPQLVVLLPTHDAGLVVDLAGQLALVADRPSAVYSTGLTLGYAVSPDGGRDVPSLVRSAMVALAHAKREGAGSAVAFTDGMADDARDRFAVARALRAAVDRREITLVFQPQFDLATGAVVGVETLARWRDLVQGSIPPTRFIRLAEQIGMSRALDRLIFEKALEQLHHWDETGVDVPRISINISPETLRSPTVPPVLARMLEAHAIAPERVTVELIESRLLDEVAVVRALEQFREFGVRVSLDDFGTGYAAFSQLVRLPIDELKVDRSFLADTEEGGTTEAVIAAMLTVAERLGLHVVAEGVERDSQLQMLRRLGCSTAQGFLLCHPLTATEYVAWHTSRARAVVPGPRCGRHDDVPASTSS